MGKNGGSLPGLCQNTEKNHAAAQLSSALTTICYFDKDIHFVIFFSLNTTLALRELSPIPSHLLKLKILFFFLYKIM